MSKVHKGIKYKHRCVGGPLGKGILMLSSPGTLVFTINGQKGYYDKDMKWRKVK